MQKILDKHKVRYPTWRFILFTAILLLSMLILGKIYGYSVVDEVKNTVTSFEHQKLTRIALDETVYSGALVIGQYTFPNEELFEHKLLGYYCSEVFANSHSQWKREKKHYSLIKKQVWDYCDQPNKWEEWQLHWCNPSSNERVSLYIDNKALRAPQKLLVIRSSLNYFAFTKGSCPD